MVAQRKATKQVDVATQSTAVKSGDVASDDNPVVRELARLQAMRAEALAWVTEIERRITALQQATCST